MITIVGASLAGLTAARELRSLGSDVEITLIGEEPWFPYDRPPLSKDALTDETVGSAIAPHAGTTGLLTEGEDQNFSWHLGVRAHGLQSAADGYRVHTSPGIDLPAADQLIVATGARPRSLIGDHLDGVHVLRTVDHTRAVRSTLTTARTVVIIGAGFIGAEIASTAIALGKHVTIVEAAAVPAANTLGPDIARWAATLHSRAGVDLITGAAVDTIDGDDHVASVTLGDGTVLPADLVIIGIGSVPNTEWAADSGIAIDDGFVADADGATSMPDVYAIGDCARPLDVRTGLHVRHQHWSAAVDQGRRAAHRIMGVPAPALRARYFWSDQYGHRIQVCGEIPVGLSPTVVDGDVAQDRFVAVFGDPADPVAVAAVDSPRTFMRARKAMDAAFSRERAAFADS
ncbi:NAD(P)/FAD-dependent oxidoreductase [Williamsia phyllosphaerae]|uniref:Pyridine nucleotide-disulfide oxidoreductase n=1 Tax=Williamsia phyllosphaerae TaxID=885042 RepID=A0ABQ1V5R8_9NOCA|nr:FAD-dependent oxidoreductase [Williamsia phyllosphaerae]GGF40212.1 pyridine nucleotide-disulfide oxidoreductase [Williamsia phyllosphaerae]